MTHAELCRVVAEKVLRKAWVALYEYQSYATSEFPDVLAFSGSTVLYEVKISHSDFLADARKEARKKWHPKVGWHWTLQERTPTERSTMARIKAEFPDLYYIQAPHLGTRRYFVCEPGVIADEEVPEGWGLVWLRGGKMFTRAESKQWRPDVHAERNILAHALRRWVSGYRTGILVRSYSGAMVGDAPKAEPVQLELEER